MATAQTKPRTTHAPARSETPPAPPQPADEPARLMSLDAYRGFIMLVMASGGFGFARVAAQFPALVAGVVGLAGAPAGPLLTACNRVARSRGEAPHGRLWEFLAYQFDHVPWFGCAFWDLIQPSFMFMVGVALPS